MKPVHCTIFASLGGALATTGYLLPTLGFFKTIGLVVFFYGLATCIGLLTIPSERPGVRFLFGLLGALALVALAGAVVYRLYALDGYSISGLLLLLPWLVFAFSPFAPERERHVFGDRLIVAKTSPADVTTIALAVFVIGFDLAALHWLGRAGTTEAIRSPWDVVHPVYFLWIFLASYGLLLLAWRRRNHHLSLIAASLHLFTMLSPALLVYGIGFGFDPFVHIATEKLIAAKGAVTPKPPYYLGQYAVVTILHETLRAPVAVIDRLLLPVMTALFLPLGSVYLLRRGFGVERGLAVLAATGLLFLPLASFASTTPQGLANLFSLMTFLVGATWLHAHRPPLFYVLLLAGAAVAVHPLSGIPVALFVLFLIFFKLRAWRHPAAKAAKAGIYVILAGLAAAAVPMLFELNARLAGTTTGLRETILRPVSDLAARLPLDAPAALTRFSPALDFAELFARNQPYLLLLAAAGGIAVLMRKKGYRRTVWVTASLAAALLLNVIVLNAGLDFANVIEYERTNYGDRLFELALLLLAPLVLAGFAWWWRGMRKTSPGVRAFGFVFIAALFTAAAYVAFPRNDAFIQDRGYSVSGHDVKAVRTMHANARAPYIVLANQSVSAAALHEYGFRTYYGDQFYYSIPTGAPLYGYYLDMVYGGAERSVMEAAMRSVSVPRAFFIINDYWTGYDEIVARAKKTADRWVAIDSGKLHIFEYEL